MSDMGHHDCSGNHATHIEAAEQVCEAKGEKLTEVRRRVLEELLNQHKPVGAYQLLPLIREGKTAAPTTAYRALDFLVKMGLAHKIESKDLYVACGVGACGRSTMFLICDQCGGAEEFDAGHALTDLEDAAKRGGFKIGRTMIEASGVCSACQAA